MQSLIGDGIGERACRVPLPRIKRFEFYSQKQAPPADVADTVMFLLQGAQPMLEPIA